MNVRKLNMKNRLTVMVTTKNSFATLGSISLLVVSSLANAEPTVPTSNRVVAWGDMKYRLARERRLAHAGSQCIGPSCGR